jgi:hypothetical protein
MVVGNCNKIGQTKKLDFFWDIYFSNSGTSVGALIASLVCVHTDDELPNIFRSSGIDLQAFARVGSKGSIRRKILRLIKQGSIF